ncbi:hypothetical protein GCM10027447_13540 [Glycomyces halotolerans]
MQASPSRPPAKPNTVRAAQALIWVQFTTIAALYLLGLNFLTTAITTSSNDETMFDVVGGGGAERWILALTALGVTLSLPVIAIGLGRRDPAAVVAAWYALAFIPLGMYIWIVARAYVATFPDGPEFFISAGTMLAVCAAMPTGILLCLSSRAARTWFAPPRVAIPEQARAEDREPAGANTVLQVVIR